MTEEEIAELVRENAGLRESLRISEHHKMELEAKVIELQNSFRPQTDKDHWFGFKSADGTRRASFDMLMVGAWSAALSNRGKWSAKVHVGMTVFDLDDAQTKEFWVKFEKYLNRE